VKQRSGGFAPAPGYETPAAAELGIRARKATAPETGAGVLNGPTPQLAANGAGRSIPILAFEDIAIGTAPYYLVEGVLPHGGLTVIWGPPKSGKSFVAFDLMMHVALGWRWRERDVEQGGVVYCAFEAGSGFAGRVEAFRRRHLGSHSGKVPFWLVAVPLDLVGEHAALIEAICAADVSPAVVVLDTLNRSLRGSESRDDDMGAYVKAADAIRAALGCAVVIVHHSGIDAHRPRGHTSLTGAVDASIAIKRAEDGLITMTVELMRDGQAGAVVGSRLEVLDVGTDARGNAVTSCVVAPAEAAGGRTKGGTKTPRLPSGARVALLSLKKAIEEDAGDTKPISNHVPHNAPLTTLEKWRAYHYRRVRDSNPDARKKAFQRAREKLQAMELVGMWGPEEGEDREVQVWLTQ
jgi:hypothetical protein